SRPGQPYRVCVHGPRATAVQTRTRHSGVGPDLATRGPRGTAEGGLSDRSAQEASSRGNRSGIAATSNHLFVTRPAGSNTLLAPRNERAAATPDRNSSDDAPGGSTRGGQTVVPDNPAL